MLATRVLSGPKIVWGGGGTEPLGEETHPAVLYADKPLSVTASLAEEPQPPNIL